MLALQQFRHRLLHRHDPRLKLVQFHQTSTDFRSDLYIDLLRNTSMLGQLPVTRFSGLKGTITYPPCAASREGGGTSAIAYGCNYLGEPGPDTGLGCVGGIRGRDGGMAGRYGSVTVHWYSQTQATGTGQWCETGE